MARTLLVVAARVAQDNARVNADERARNAYLALADEIRTRLGNDVEIVDSEVARLDRNLIVRLARRFCGLSTTVAICAFLRLRGVSSVFSAGESPGMRLALLMRLLPRRPRHVCVTFHFVTGPKLQFSFRRLRPHQAIDALIVYSQISRAYGIEEFKIPPQKIFVSRGFVDARFYRPMPTALEAASIIVGSVGSEQRDYRTFLGAADGLPANISVQIVPTGMVPDFNRSAVAGVPIPGNVKLLQFEMGGLRDFYSRCDILCVSVYENMTAYGLTSLLEAMAMGKAVIATRSKGLSEYIIEGETGMTVAPGDVEGWRGAMRRLADDAQLRMRLGQNARRWVLQNSDLDLWSAELAEHLHTGERRPESARFVIARPEAQSADRPSDAETSY